MTIPRLQRTRQELADFLRSRRERVKPEDVGLPRSGRRRTPGLRREEVAALAGVGLTWYTWLEQGREIGVSADFLERLARALTLDDAERRHLFLLAQQRLPVEPGRTWCEVPSMVRKVMESLTHCPAYVLNLRWDVLGWNRAAERVFGFSSHEPSRRNLLWLLFVDPGMRHRFVDWERQTPQILSNFRLDFTRSGDDPDMAALVDELERVSPEFRDWWRRHDVHAPCRGVRRLSIDELGILPFEHTTLVIDEERHLRLVVYALADEAGEECCAQWRRADSSLREA